MLFTVGYGNKGLVFIKSIMEKYQIDLLVDVRERPFSQYNPGMNRDALKKELGTAYVWKGNIYGGLSVKITDLDIDILSNVGTQGNTVIMCAESDYHKCHRHYEIARRLVEKGVKVIHIIDENKSEPASFNEPEPPKQNQISLF